MSTKKPAFFEDPANADLLPYIIRCVRDILELDDDVQCDLLKQGRSFCIKTKDGTLSINKMGDRIKLTKGILTKSKSFMLSVAYSYMILDGYPPRNGVFITDHLLHWLPKEQNIAYFEYNNERWYSERSLGDIIELESKHHIFSRYNQDRVHYKSVNELITSGLTDINGLNVLCLHTDTKKITFATLDGILNVIRQPDLDITTRDAITPFVKFTQGIKGQSMTCLKNDTITTSYGEIRITKSKMMSIIDIIRIFLNTSIHNAPRVLAKIKDRYGSMIDLTHDFLFYGQGQTPTTVIDLDNLKTLIDIIPGDIDSQVRKSFVDEVDQAVNPPDILNDITFALDGLKKSDKTIRITADKRVSVYDVIEIYTGLDNPRKVWHDLIQAHPEVVTISNNLQFPGMGQRSTPVMDANGIVQLIMLLPGKNAAMSRNAFANIIVRYLGGDLTLIDDVKKINDIQQRLPLDHAMKFFVDKKGNDTLLLFEKLRHDNNIDQIPISDLDRKRGIYLIGIGKENENLLFKFGETRTSTKDRTKTHLRRYNEIEDSSFEAAIEVFYFRETLFGLEVESYLKHQFECKGIYMGYRYKIADQGSGNNELVTINENYGLMDLIKIIDDAVDFFEGNKTEVIPYAKSERVLEMDHEYRMKQLDVDIAMVDVKKLELQIALLKLQKGI